jgi:Acetyl xylan esterase (AXE1)
MPHFDLPLDQLETYGGAVAPPSDLEAFWQSTFRDADEFPLDLRLEPVGCTYSISLEISGIRSAAEYLHPTGAVAPHSAQTS